MTDDENIRLICPDCKHGTVAVWCINQPPPYWKCLSPDCRFWTFPSCSASLSKLTLTAEEQEKHATRMDLLIAANPDAGLEP